MQNNAFTAIYLQNSFADIARVLSEFFRDLDVVPSDVIAGLVLLRKRQQLVRFRTVQQVRYNCAGFFYFLLKRSRLVGSCSKYVLFA